MIVFDGPANSTVAKNETAGVGPPNSSVFTKEYCTNEAKEMIINSQEITLKGHIANTHDEHVHINWKMTVKPPYLAIHSGANQIFLDRRLSFFCFSV